MDVVQRWSERLARRVVPAEADFAADVGAAYAAGGQARKNLMPRPSVQPGAFGPGTFAADLPLILQALAHAGDVLLALLRSAYLSNALAAGSLLVALRAAHGHGQEPETSQAAASPGARPEPPQAVPVNERRAVEQAFGSLCRDLTSAGFTPERAGQIAYELLEELVADAADAAIFVDALSAEPDDGGLRKLRAKTNGKELRRSSGR